MSVNGLLLLLACCCCCSCSRSCCCFKVAEGWDTLCCGVSLLIAGVLSGLPERMSESKKLSSEMILYQYISCYSVNFFWFDQITGLTKALSPDAANNLWIYLKAITVGCPFRPSRLDALSVAFKRKNSLAPQRQPTPSSNCW